MLQNIRVVLVETSHTGNMGSVARAMKTMGMENLWLVNPLVKPDSQAIALAAGASEVIANAQIVSSLDQALVGCSLVAGTSARNRALCWPELSARECGEKCAASLFALQAKHQPPATVALVFGRERAGLTNEELQKCHYHVTIAANPHYSSLNLAMAVQVLCYEVRMAWLACQASALAVNLPCSSPLQPVATQQGDYPLAEDLERFYQHLQQVLLQRGFIRANHPGQVMNKLRRLFNRAHPERQELNILRGILTAFEPAIEQKKSIIPE